MTKIASLFFASLFFAFLFLKLFGFNDQGLRNEREVIENIYLAEKQEEYSNPVQSHQPTGASSSDLLKFRELEKKYEDSIFSQRQRQVYSTYDEETLIAMADQWNMAAIKELAYRYAVGKPELIEDGSPETTNKFIESYRDWNKKKKEYLSNAILHGDKELLSFAAIAFSPDINFSDPQSIRSALIEDLAFYEFVAMRGLPEEKYNKVIEKISIYESSHGALNLSPEDKIKILDQAKNIYENFESQRIEMGMGPFDNSISESYLSNSEQALERYKKNVGDNYF